MPFSEVSFPKVVKQFLKLHFIRLLYGVGSRGMPCSTCGGQKKQLFLGNRATVTQLYPSHMWLLGTKLSPSRLWQASGATEPFCCSGHALFMAVLSPFPTPCQYLWTQTENILSGPHSETWLLGIANQDKPNSSEGCVRAMSFHFSVFKIFLTMASGGLVWP